VGREINFDDIFRREVKMGNKYTISVYLDNGVVFYYDVKGPDKASEHSAAIVKDGYRHNPSGSREGEEPLFEHYGPHRILKVKVTGGLVPTNYHDKTKGT